MTKSEQIISEALSLPPADRLDVIEQLWDSIAVSPHTLEPTDAQRQELDRRIDEMDASPHVGIPWENVQAELRNPR
jgi:putative addiction module component (TIGR02574 family)